MVSQLFEFIGLKIKIANPWVDTFAVNCVELPYGNQLKPQKRIVNLEGKEKTDLGITDVKGAGFYIKIDPKFVYSAGRQLSSCVKEFEVTVKFRFLFFSINCDVEREKLTLENIFSNNIRKITFGEYGGPERLVKIEITQTNTDAATLFKEEVGKDLVFGADSIFVAVDGNIKFLSTDDCEQTCGVSTSESILAGLNFCDENIVNLLSEEQKNCLIQFLCEMPTKFKKLTFTGSINGANAIFVASDKIVQLFKNGQLLLLGADYTLSADELTATLLVAPDPAFNDALTFFGNI